MLQGCNGEAAAPPYEVLRTTNEVSEALTRRWAVAHILRLYIPERGLAVYGQPAM